MILPTNDEVEVLRTSNSKYDKLTMEIWFQGEPLALISQDRGLLRLELELFGYNDNQENGIRIPLDDFLLAVKLAKDSLNSN